MKRSLKISAEAKDNKAIIRIDGYISQWYNHAAGFKAKLDQLIADGITEAEIYINSGGGSCFEANEIANELKRFTGSKTARIGALCASAATYIACICDKAIAASNMSYMIHKPMLDISGNSDEIESGLKLLKNLEDNYAKTYSEKTGLKEEKIRGMWKSDYWMNATEAKSLSFIDEVEGEESEITPEDILTLEACGYKNLPNIAATIKPTQTQNPEKTDMKEKLITVLALAATMSEAQILAHIENLKVEAAKAGELERQLNDLKTEKTASEIKAVLDVAETNKQILPAQRAYYEKQLKGDFAETKAHIESLPKAAQLTKEVGSGTGGSASIDRSKWTYADFQEKDPAALQKLSEEDPDKFEELFNAHYNQK